MVQAAIGMGVVSHFFGCAPKITDLQVGAVSDVSRDQIGGAPDFEPKTLQFDHYLRVEISTHTDLAKVENAIYPKVSFCGSNDWDQIGAEGPYYKDGELYESKITQTGPHTFYGRSWPVRLVPNPATRRFSYVIYVIPRRNLQDSILSPGPGEDRLLPYDIESDGRPLCVRLEMIQAMARPRNSNVAVISRQAVTVAYHQHGGPPQNGGPPQTR